jgi:hypothetical protein
MSQMDVSLSIERWFATYNETADFLSPSRRDFFRVIGPRKNADRIIYCTKASIVDRIIEEHGNEFDVGAICQYGLPVETDIGWLLDTIGERRLLFLGDLDPADIMIFAWLRARLPRARVTHFGINDELISRLEYEIPPNHQIPLNDTERKSVTQLKTFVPDFAELLGQKCLAVLDSHFKIELEALLLGPGNPSAIMKHAQDWC